MQFIVDTYILEYVESENKYYISFKDSVDKDCRIEINKKVFNEYIESKKSYIKVKNEIGRYMEHSELTDITLYNRCFNKPKSVEDTVIENIRKENILLAKKGLTPTQRRRIELHIEDGIKLEDLAKLEGVRRNKIDKSISLGIKKIKKFLKNGGAK